MELQHLKKGSERKAVKRAHGYRKFFNTNLIRAKVNIAIKELLLGLIAKNLISLGISIQLFLIFYHSLSFIYRDKIISIPLEGYNS